MNNSANKSTNPIGVFDSGLGGLTVVREIRRLLPNEDIVYLGDIARLPYGIKSRNQIIQFSIHNAEFLLKKKVKAIVIACNSSSANAYYVLKRRYSVPVIDVISPASRAACDVTHNGRIGVIGTSATVNSHAYQKEISKRGKHINVFAASCPLFVTLVEEGWIEDPITDAVIERHVAPLLKKKIDTLILGCTHYPLLKKAIKRYIGSRIAVIDSSPCAYILQHYLQKEHMYAVRKRAGVLKVFLTDLSPGFMRVGQGFLRKKIKNVKMVKVG